MFSLESLQEKISQYLKENSTIATIVLIIVAVAMFFGVNDDTIKNKVKK